MGHTGRRSTTTTGRGSAQRLASLNAYFDEQGSKEVTSKWLGGRLKAAGFEDAKQKGIKVWLELHVKEPPSPR